MMAARGVVLLLGVFVVLAIISLVVLFIIRRTRRGSVREPCCGQCDYPVRGLSTLACPECGSDLREVGIRTPEMNRPVGPWLAVLFWSLALPVPALVLSGILAAFLMPTRQEYHDDWRLAPTSSVGVAYIDLSATASSWKWPWQSAASPTWNDLPDSLQFSVFNSKPGDHPAVALLAIDLEDETWSTGARPKSRPLAELDDAALSAWLTSASGEDAAILGPAIGDVIDEIHHNPLGRPAITAAVHTPSIAPLLSTAQRGSMSMTGPLSGAALGLLIFWIVVWLVGCVRFHRRHSRGAAG